MGQSLPELPFTREELIGSGAPTQTLIAAAKYNDLEVVALPLALATM